MDPPSIIEQVKIKSKFSNNPFRPDQYEVSPNYVSLKNT